MRVVSTTCSNTEIVCALGCESFLVGVDDHSDYPPSVVERLPRVGPDLSVDPKKVEALRPDLVIASLTVPGHEKVVDGLQKQGLKVIAPEPTCLEDVFQNIEDIATLLGVPAKGEELSRSMCKALSPQPVTGKRPRILVEWWPKPVIVPGSDSWVTRLIELAGGLNPLGSEDVKSRPMSNEEWGETKPDAVVISWCGVSEKNYRSDVVQKRNGGPGYTPIQEDRIFCISEAYLGRPGPRLIDGYRELIRVVEACRDSN